MEVKLLLGPPGTGKTTRLLKVLEEELMTVPPEKIAYVSYTRKGAYEGRDRAREAMGLKINQLPFFRTLHSIAYRQQGLTRGSILEDNKDLIKKFSERMGMNFRGYYSEDFTHNDDRYLFFDTLHRNNPKIAADYMMDMNVDILKWVRNNYRRFKTSVGLPDYTDIIERFCDTAEELPVDVAIIDEAQDLTTLQWKMVWLAFSNCKRVYIAGDDDQAIYEWNGADVAYFLDLKTTSMEVLSKSYRLPKRIHEYADEVVALIQKRIPKEFSSNGEDGEVLHIVDFKEADIDNGESWLFLSRNNWFLKPVEAWLKDTGIAYRYKDKASITPSVVTAINKHGRLCKKGFDGTPQDRQMVNFFCNLPAKYERPWYDEFTKLKPETIKYYRRVIGSGHDPSATRIQVSTIHGVKGGEADNVVLLTDITRAVHKNMVQHHDAEMRCYYVGVTRARKKLFIVEPKTAYSFPIFGGNNGN